MEGSVPSAGTSAAAAAASAVGGGASGESDAQKVKGGGPTTTNNGTGSSGKTGAAALGSGEVVSADATTTSTEHEQNAHIGHAHLVQEQSFGDVFDQVCRTRNVITPATSILFKWHQMNLEVGCGASFPDLGTLWNEDEAYGYDGDHVATKHSWKALVDSLSQNLDIVYSSPVRHVHIIEPDPNDINNAEENDPSAAAAAPAKKRAKKKRIKPSVTFVPVRPATSRKQRKDFSSPPPPSERQSRRIRGEDASAASARRSLRANKGQAVDRYVGETKLRASGSRKRRRDSDEDGNTTAAATKPNNIYIPPKPPKKTIVQITLDNGTVLEADHVVCTLPLGILKLGVDNDIDNYFDDDDDPTDYNDEDPCKVVFDPPLPKSKQLAIKRLGAGLLNKCVLSFEYVFWQDVDFLGLAKDVTNSYLVLNAHAFTNQPVLVFLFGGTRAKELEDWTDVDIVHDCLSVLERICNTSKSGGVRRSNNNYTAAGTSRSTSAYSSLPDPIDYRVTRWGNEQYSRMAFTYVPPGVDGFNELRNMSLPINTHQHGNRNRGDGKKDAVAVPTILFAGEHTTPYHPSTIHGAFNSGIREAYRLDCALFPHANDEITSFSNDELYERTFSLPRRFFGDDSVPVRNVPTTDSAAAEDTEPENEDHEEGHTSSTQLQASGEVSVSATSATEAAAEETGSSSLAASRPRRQHRRRGAGTIMKLRRRGSNNNGAGAAVAMTSTENTSRRVNGGRTVAATQQQPSRRSPRVVTAAASASTGEAAGVSATGVGDQSPSPAAVNEPEGRDLTSLENDMLIRGMESYGRYNYDYLQEMILPVHHGESASEDYWTLDRVRKRCTSLKQELRKLSAKGTNSWKRWIAKAVYESPSNTFLAESAASAGAESQQKRRPVGRPPSKRARATTTAIAQLNHQDNGDNNKKSSKDKRGKKSNSYVSNATYDDISKAAAKAVAVAKTKSGRLIYKPRTLSLNKKGADGGGGKNKIAKTRSGRVIHKPPTTSP